MIWPLSRKDMGVILRAGARAHVKRLRLVEIHVSEQRLHVDGLKIASIPVRRTAALGFSEGHLIVEGRPPITFEFPN